MNQSFEMSGVMKGDQIPDHDSTWDCTPRLYRLTLEEEREAWKAFRTEFPGVVCHDSLWSQLKELMGILRPMDKLADAGREERAKLFLDERGGPENYGVWVYYPWLAKAVKVLEEPEFIRVRTNRNMYKITPEEQRTLGEKRIGVVGMSVGKSIARVLTTERICGEIRIADFDKLELSNMNRIQTSLLNLGVPKTTIVAREIAEQDPFIKVTVFPQGINEDNVEDFITQGGVLDLLFDECDSIDIKINCRVAAKKHGIPLIMETNDLGMIDIERYDAQPHADYFHGLLDGVSLEEVKGLKSSEEKSPFVARILELDKTSVALRASLLEIGGSVESWPQLSSEIAFGSGIAVKHGISILLGNAKPKSARMRYLGESYGLINAASKSLEDGGEPLKESAGNLEYCDCHSSSSDGHWDPSDECVKELVKKASRATSGGNSQPWRCAVSSRGLEVYLDQSRAGGYLDFDHSGSIVALTSFVEIAKEEAEYQGWHVEVAFCSDWKKHNHFATLKFRKPTTSSEEDRPLPISRQRATNRKKERTYSFDEKAVFHGRVSELIEPLRFQHTHIVEFQEFEVFGKLLIGLERERMLDSEGSQELRNEIVDKEIGYGISIPSMELSDSEELGLRIYLDEEVQSYWRGMGDGVGARLTEVYEKQLNSSLGFVVFTLSSFGFDEIVTTSQEIHHTWCLLNSAGFQVQPVSAGIFVARRNDQNGNGTTWMKLKSMSEKLTGSSESPFFVLRVHEEGPLEIKSSRMSCQLELVNR